MARDLSLDNPAESPEEDEFNRWPFSQRLAETIATFDSSSGAPVIGLFGRWGYGKSTVLNFVKQELRRGDRAVIFEFNPWMFKDQDSLLASFFHGLAAALDQSLEGTGKKVGTFLKDYGGILNLVPVVGTAMGKLGDRLGDKLSGTSLEKQRGQVIEIMRAAPRNVVVLIDDLDRLDRDEILTMLKLVRLSANFPRVVYLLAFDDEMVARAAGEKYGGGAAAGRQFLEKIVQYPFYLPAVGFARLLRFVSKRAREACNHARIALSDEEWERFESVNRKCFAVRLTTPRQAIRYGNALRFALPMLKGEVDPLQQMLVEGMRVLFPELYAAVRDRGNSLLDAEGLRHGGAFAVGSLHEASETEKTAGSDLLAEMHRAPSSHPVFSLDYFDRYFGYAVAPDDISGAEMQELAGIARTGSDNAASEYLRRLFQRNPRVLRQRLVGEAPKLELRVKLWLALLLAAHGSEFPGMEIAIAELAGNNFDAYTSLMQRAQPLPVALSIAQELIRLKDSGATREILLSMRKDLMERIKRESDSPVYAVYPPQDALRLLQEWQSIDPEGVRQYVNERIAANPAEAFQFLRLFPEYQVNYGFISELASPQVLAEAVQNRLNSGVAPEEQKIAHEFMEVYQSKKK